MNAYDTYRYIQTFRFSDTITEHMLVICSLNKYGYRFDMGETDQKQTSERKTIDRNQFYNQFYEQSKRKLYLYSNHLRPHTNNTNYRLKHKKKNDHLIECFLFAI